VCGVERIENSQNVWFGIAQDAKADYNEGKNAKQKSVVVDGVEKGETRRQVSR